MLALWNNRSNLWGSYSPVHEVSPWFEDFLKTEVKGPFVFDKRWGSALQKLDDYIHGKHNSKNDTALSVPAFTTLTDKLLANHWYGWILEEYCGVRNRLRWAGGNEIVSTDT